MVDEVPAAETSVVKSESEAALNSAVVRRTILGYVLNRRAREGED